MLNEDTGITQETIDDAKRRAEKRFETLTSEQIAHLRSKLKYDLFFLATGGLGFDKASENLHGDLCRWHHLHETDRFRMILLPRSHYKSTFMTISDTMQIILPDVLGMATYPRNLGPDARVMICHESAESAGNFLQAIQQHFTANEVIVGLFPECVPDLKKHRLNKTELELPRSKMWGEPTVFAMGVGSKKQGYHFDYIKADDLQGEEATYSETALKGTIRWIDNLQSYLMTPKTDHIDFIGTRWKFTDTYSHVMNVYEDLLKVYRRSVEEVDPVTGKKVSIFPEQFTEDSLKILRKNKLIWAAQYLNDPHQSGLGFNPEWKRFFEIRKGGNGFEIAAKDLAGNWVFPVSQMRKYILVDPAINGNAGFLVTGVDNKGRVYTLEALKGIWSPPQLVDLIFKKVVQWNVPHVIIEKVLFSQVFEHWIAREMGIRGIRFKIEGVPTRQKAKDDRIAGLSNHFSAGLIYFHSSQEDIIKEFDEFGASDDIHILDALAYGPLFWKNAVPGNVLEGYKKAEQTLLEGISKTSGYTKITYT